VDGDFYINGATGEIYKKQRGVYSIIGSARSGTVGGGVGATGPQGPPGADGEAFMLGDIDGGEAETIYGGIDPIDAGGA
jgi:hypothetical protein